MPVDRTHDISNAVYHIVRQEIPKLPAANHMEGGANTKGYSQSEQSPIASISSCLTHIKDIEALGQVLTNAGNAAFPNRGRSRYNEAHVLLLSWEDDDLGVIDEVTELQDVFEYMYQYETEGWKIPSKRSHNTLASKILQFLGDYEAKDSLLIVYYGGHGLMNDDRQCIWSCTAEADSVEVRWYAIQTMLEEAQSDVVLLLDCCAATSSATGAGSGITEVIAACGFETWAPGVGEHSFTRSLTEELKYLRRTAPFSTALLHNTVLSRVKYWKPRYGVSASDRERRKTPIYIVLSNEAKQRSIEIAPISVRDPVRDLFKMSLEPAASHESSASSQSSYSADSTRPSYLSKSSVNEVWPDKDFLCPKVLISIALEEDQWLSTQQWENWLRSIPALVKYAKIEGVYGSDSTLLLLSVSIAVWNLLPADPAITFVGFSRTEEMLRLASPSQSQVQATAKSIDKQDMTWTADPRSHLEAMHVHSGDNGRTLDFRQKEPEKFSQGEVFTAEERSLQDQSYGEKFPQLEAEYQSAVRLLKSSEKMLGCLRDELIAYKEQHEELRGDLDIKKRSRSERFLESGGATQSYGEKFPQREADYQSAVRLLKSSEKMLGRLRDELIAYKEQNEELRRDLDIKQRSRSERFLESGGATQLEIDHKKRQAEIGTYPKSAGTAADDMGRAFAEPKMIAPEELCAILDNLPSKDVLLLDVRVHLQYSHSRIVGALNLCIPTTLLKRSKFDVRKLAKTFEEEQEKAKFTQWRETKLIVVYDTQSSIDKFNPSTILTLKKFTVKGWRGKPCIVRGGFLGVSKEFPDLIDGRPSHERSSIVESEVFASLNKVSTKYSATTSQQKFDCTLDLPRMVRDGWGPAVAMHDYKRDDSFQSRGWLNHQSSSLNEPFRPQSVALSNDPNMNDATWPTSSSIAPPARIDHFTGKRSRLQCWDHGCNGRVFPRLSDLLIHQRGKSETGPDICPRCGASFARQSALNGHLEEGKCTKKAGGPLKKPSAENYYHELLSGIAFDDAYTRD